MSIKDCTNQATFFRREVLRRVAEAYLDGMQPEAINRIPYDLFPRRGGAHDYRCCIYKAREIVKHRCLSALGVHLKDAEDDAVPLSAYAAEAMERTAIAGPVLSVLDVACESCIQAEYVISNLCHGCVARPCQVNCPRDCISFVNQQARIDEATCINCGKCQKVCPYHAVVRVPVPCQEACPVDAIYRNQKTGKQRIDFEKCIACGQCMRDCPFGAILETSQIVDVLRAIDGDCETVALCAPAVAGQFEGGLGGVLEALKRFGFDQVLEVAEGADETCQAEAREFKERVLEKGEPFMTTSCCPAYMEAARRHMPELESCISETPTPMHFVAETVRQRSPDAVTVFVGPCVAKRHEGMLDECVDYVLTFEELFALFAAKGIEPAEAELPATGAHAEGRGFAVSGGVAGAVQSVADDPAKVRPVQINGLDRKGLAMLRSFLKGKCPGNLVEVMTCEGGCVNGAGVCNRPARAARAVKEAAAGSQSLLD